MDFLLFFYIDFLDVSAHLEDILREKKYKNISKKFGPQTPPNLEAFLKI